MKEERSDLSGEEQERDDLLGEGGHGQGAAAQRNPPGVICDLWSGAGTGAGSGSHHFILI